MEQENKHNKISKSALKIFVLGATIVYGGAFAYCYLTSNTLAMSLVAGAAVVMSGLATFTYKTL